MKQRVKQTLIDWRRSRLLNEIAKGRTLTSISEELQVSVPTLSRDLSILRRQARERQSEYIADLPFRHQLSIKNLDNCLSELWKLYGEEADVKMKKAIIDSITETVIKQQIILGDPAKIEDALRAVSRIKEEISQSAREGELEAQNET